MNNKILTGLVVALTAAVLYLFFTMPGGKEDSDETSNETTDKTDDTDTKEIPKIDLSGDGKVVIAYVDGDMVNQKYLFLIDGRNALAVMQEQSDKKLRGQLQSAAAREAAIQKQVEFMTTAEKEKAMRELETLQRNYQASEQREMATLQNQQTLMNEQLYLNVQQVLDDYCAKNNIDYVYNFQKGGPFLYVNKANDITVHVLTTLNEKYQKQKGVQ